MRGAMTPRVWRREGWGGEVQNYTAGPWPKQKMPACALQLAKETNISGGKGKWHVTLPALGPPRTLGSSLLPKCQLTFCDTLHLLYKSCYKLMNLSEPNNFLLDCTAGKRPTIFHL